MYYFKKPSDQVIRRFLEDQRAKSFSYQEVGASNNVLPSGYKIDRNRIRLGSGKQTFEKAKSCLRNWEMYNLDWIYLCWRDTPIEVGAAFAVVVRALGLWIVNACRIVYLLETGGSTEKFGFAVGTLPHHAEAGEERFSIEWHHDDDSIWYEILAFSRPNQVFTQIAYPYVRRLQKQFAADSMKAIDRVVSN